MPTSQTISLAARSLSLGMLLGLFPLAGHNSPEAWRGDFFPAYVQRGDEVEERFRDYTEQLAGYRERLAAALRHGAPELLAHMDPHDPTASGYQILPQIIADAPVPPQAATVAYSWPWTEKLIDHEAAAIARADADLARSTAMSPAGQSVLLASLAHSYRIVSARHGVVDAHVRYNRLWQAAIAADRLGYDRETALHRLVIERRKINERLRRVQTTFEKGPTSFRRGDAIRVSEIARDLKSRQALLSQRIDRTIDAIDTPAFLTVERSPAGWIVRLPLSTDIEDRDFVEKVKQIVESTWRITDRRNFYRVELDVSYLTRDRLYAEGGPPSGAKLDMENHLARFPAGSAILTTGGVTTHVRNDAVVLGPGPLTPRVLAHEFGHILGFRDRYVRGYRNLGRDGFQVLEAVIDPGDIMSASAEGAVLASHFFRLIEHYAGRAPSPAPKPIQTPARPVRALTRS